MFRALALGFAMLLVGSLQVTRGAGAAIGTVEQSSLAIRAASGVDVATASGAGVDIAVIDSGVVPTRFLGGQRLLYGPDFSVDVINPALRNLDAFGHGTNVASIISAIAPKSRIVSLKVASSNGSTSLAQLTAAIGWVVANAHTEGRNIRVLNLSYGMTPSKEGNLLAHALRLAWRAGITVVASAGNDGLGMTIDAPADDSQFIAVGAAKQSLKGLVPADFSSGSALPLTRTVDVLALGADIVGARVAGSFLDERFPGARSGDEGFRGSGTSQAAAVVSGVLAGIISRKPTLSPSQAKAILLDGARPIAGYSTAFQGRGLVNQQASLARSVPASFWADLMNGIGSLWVPSSAQPLAILRPIVGSAWNGPEWSGNRWSDATWSGNRWSGSRWE